MRWQSSEGLQEVSAAVLPVGEAATDPSEAQEHAWNVFVLQLVFCPLLAENTIRSLLMKNDWILNEEWRQGSRSWIIAKIPHMITTFVYPSTKPTAKLSNFLVELTFPGRNLQSIASAEGL